MSRSSPRSLVRRSVGGVVGIALIAAAMSIPAATLGAEPTNMVLVWNENAINVIHGGTTATPPGLGNAPPLSSLHLAMVHGAIYDAVNAIDGRHQPYLKGLSASSTASKTAAVAQAAHDVLWGLAAALPLVQDRVDGMLATSLAMVVVDPVDKANGIQIGKDAAAAMLAARNGDGRFDVEPFPTSTDVGKWRVVPPSPASNVFGQFATVKPLTLKSPDQLRTEGPLDLTSAEYAAEFNEVKALGAQSGSSRTPEQTLLAGFVIANPVFYMNKGLRDIATAEGLSTTEQALLFVKTSMGSADALIACWNDKANYLIWRPQTAIRAANSDGNPATAQDDNWLSLFPTPGYPDHPSGYNCYTQGLWYGARLFFGTDKMDFQLTSPGSGPATAISPVVIPGSTRPYHRFSDVTRDTIEGRILTGFHFRTADVQGAWIGKKAAQWVDKHYFAPVD